MHRQVAEMFSKFQKKNKNDGLGFLIVGRQHSRQRENDDSCTKFQSFFPASEFLIIPFNSSVTER